MYVIGYVDGFNSGTFELPYLEGTLEIDESKFKDMMRDRINQDADLIKLQIDYLYRDPANAIFLIDTVADLAIRHLRGEDIEVMASGLRKLMLDFCPE